MKTIKIEIPFFIEYRIIIMYIYGSCAAEENFLSNNNLLLKSVNII